MKAPKTRQATGWWEWFQALEELAPSDGAHMTGSVWARRCWSWARGRAEEEVLDAVEATAFEDLLACRPRGTERSLYRHLTELQRVGLLERHRARSRSGPNVYVPRVPAAWVPGQSTTCHQWQVKETRPATSGRSEDDETCHQWQTDLPPAAGAPLSPEDSEPPSRVRAREDGREGARERRGGGGRPSSPEQQEAAHALEEVLGSLPAEVTRKIADGYRGQCAAVMAQLLGRGWRPHHVITEVQGSFAGVGNVGAVIRKRLVDLLERPAPTSAPWRAPVDPSQGAAPAPTSAAEYVAARRAQEERERAGYVSVSPEVLAAMRSRGSRTPAVAQEGQDEEQPRASEHLPEEASA